jgi:YD repeat-containing protein
LARIYACSPDAENRTHNNLNQITAVGPTALQYDANGNLTDDGTHAFAWDAKNRLRSPVDNSVSTRLNSLQVGSDLGRHWSRPTQVV